MPNHFLPERDDESKFIYQLIIPIDETIGLHVTLKRRFGLLDVYSYEKMIDGFQSLFATINSFTIRYGALNSYEDGLQYYEVISDDLPLLRSKILSLLGSKVNTRDPQYEVDDAKFHVSVETPEKRATMLDLESSLVSVIKLQVGARGEDNKLTQSFILGSYEKE